MNENYYIDKTKLENDLNNFWTDEKLGEYKGLKNTHYMILLKNLKIDSTTFFNQVSKNRFTCEPFSPIPLSKFLSLSKISSYVGESYLSDCLEVTSPRPAIGRGEFLLASTFGNVKFSKKRGDLIIDGKRVEVKGKNANLGGDGKFKQMNKSVVFSIYRLLKEIPETSEMSLETIKDIETKIKKSKDNAVEVMGFLQNIPEPSLKLAKDMVSIFNKSGDLLKTIASSHLLYYMKYQKGEFLITFNDNVFCGFDAPKNLEESYKIVEKFNISGWRRGNSGITFTVKSS